MPQNEENRIASQAQRSSLVEPTIKLTDLCAAVQVGLVVALRIRTGDEDQVWIKDWDCQKADLCDLETMCEQALLSPRLNPLQRRDVLVARLAVQAIMNVDFDPAEFRAMTEKFKQGRDQAS